MLRPRTGFQVKALPAERVFLVSLQTQIVRRAKAWDPWQPLPNGRNNPYKTQNLEIPQKFQTFLREKIEKNIRNASKKCVCHKFKHWRA
jgi:hypothetical protein